MTGMSERKAVSSIERSTFAGGKIELGLERGRVLISRHQRGPALTGCRPAALLLQGNALLAEGCLASRRSHVRRTPRALRSGIQHSGQSGRLVLCFVLVCTHSLFQVSGKMDMSFPAEKLTVKDKIPIR
ncbi:hypothetical protein HNY73_004896 [Argiope bruennichi]|uniref:Uncharacterized protein n=1 Tax=Argiope bruennichi TaxID=94029 RepID=A0A8T0FQF6_ARGBR|nr:hypothetical protein HNY73_004896 [Argiope bruennichi]